MDRIKIVAEIGLNHNGSLDEAIRLINAAKQAGCDYVKFQKRNIQSLYTPEKLAEHREGPFGTTYGEEKEALEFNVKQYRDIAAYCAAVEIGWFASTWDLSSVEFFRDFQMPYLKIPSARARDKALLMAARDAYRQLVISVGMCTLTDVQKIVALVGSTRIATLLYCKSGYPTPINELNLLAIPMLQKKFPLIPIGYSGHEVGVPTTICAAALGATMIERHLTMDRSAYGSDHSASLEPEGMRKVVAGIRAWERARGNGELIVAASELEALKRLPVVDTL